MSDGYVLAVPKGRILDELGAILERAEIAPEADFFDSKSRKLRFSTNNPKLDIIRVRAFDVATFVAQGAADLGVIGSDALEEFNYSEVYAPVDLGIGHCRLSVAMPEEAAVDQSLHTQSHIRIATKYPNLTKRHFANKGVQAECIKLNGAMEIAPSLGMVRRIVDLVSTGGTLKANGLVEMEKIMDVSSRLIVNRSSLKNNGDDLKSWISAFENSVS